MGLQKIRVICVIRGKKLTHSQLTTQHSFQSACKKTNPLPSSLRQAQDDNNGITCFLELYKLTHSHTTHPFTTHSLTSFQSFKSACKKTNPLPSCLRQAQDDNNGITCFLELYKLTTHPLTTHNLSR